MTQNGDGMREWAGRDVSPQFAALLERVNELHDFGCAMGVLNWDREVNAPKRGIPMRVTQMVTLGAHLHRLATSDEQGELIENAGAELLYLPPYSPDFNPIEMCWSKVKQLLRSAKARSLEKLESSVADALTAITPQDMQGCFHHCGYGL